MLKSRWKMCSTHIYKPLLMASRFDTHSNTHTHTLDLGTQSKANIRMQCVPATWTCERAAARHEAAACGPNCHQLLVTVDRLQFLKPPNTSELLVTHGAKNNRKTEWKTRERSHMMWPDVHAQMWQRCFQMHLINSGILPAVMPGSFFNCITSLYIHH